ncbi:hypothetical protein MM_3363 [Methanosarcina mazei Go1]|uniref:Uncharacterized protein n=1 Tax=Methanosarcina mazei (strain ATCC BAA-159 / DSM 3647 / Goe1 / Go1 / JCM 11833 / OCM 88) TaxID=192952 RepID=Q8PRT0_METMA|nr:hypothetical protein MM_3363 [Methanosarcina mazei Go1]
MGGFNPCFSGSCSRIKRKLLLKPCNLVSILVLVDLAHECIPLISALQPYRVSILVLVDLAHECNTATNRRA